MSLTWCAQQRLKLFHRESSKQTCFSVWIKLAAGKLDFVLNVSLTSCKSDTEKNLDFFENSMTMRNVFLKKIHPFLAQNHKRFQKSLHESWQPKTNKDKCLSIWLECWLSSGICKTHSILSPANVFANCHILHAPATTGFLKSKAAKSCSRSEFFPLFAQSRKAARAENNWNSLINAKARHCSWFKGERLFGNYF